MWSMRVGDDNFKDSERLLSVHQINTLIGWQTSVLKYPVLKGELAKG